jgi:hypothetical protein
MQALYLLLLLWTVLSCILYLLLFYLFYDDSFILFHPSVSTSCRAYVMDYRP